MKRKPQDTCQRKLTWLSWAPWLAACACGTGAGSGVGAARPRLPPWGAGAGHVSATTGYGTDGGGACPVTTVSATISVLGSSTIFCAAICMPFLNSKTVASLPSTLNL